MELAAAGLKEQPFRSTGKLPCYVSYAAQRDALVALHRACESPSGLCLLQGPTLSGKSTLMRQFIRQLPESCSVAIVDGDGMDSRELVHALLTQFGFEARFDSLNESLGMLRVYAQQQAAHHEAPIIVVENTHGLKPSGLHTLCDLAKLRAKALFAVKLVLVSDRSLQPLVEAASMEFIRRRVSADVHLRPLTRDEAAPYVHAKLEAAGSLVPTYLFPKPVCIELWEASGGWPGILDRLALLALARSATLPVSLGDIDKPALPEGTWGSQKQHRDISGEQDPGPAPPKLYISENDVPIHELLFDKPRFLVGRSRHNDVAIGSRFISRHHLLLVRHGSATFLMDLNSTNGTLVNSERVSNHVLAHNDIIKVGSHTIRFSDPHATQREGIDHVEVADTAIMQSLDDMRRLLAQENTAVLPEVSENLPTLGN